MRMSGWEDFALPLTLVFAVAFALTLRQGLPSAAPQAIAGETQPDYVMTITAKRLPADCRSPATRTPSCTSALAGDARIEMREGSSRLADRAQEGAAEGAYAY